MPVRNGIALLIALSTLTFLIACGNSSPRAVPPPTGGFTNSKLSGTYVFSSSGFDVNGAFLTMVGSFVANGNGGITGGAIDVTSLDPQVGISPNVAIASGTYRIGVDGRGEAQLNNGSPLGTITLDIVLTSSSHGLVTEFDNSGTGSGTIDVQPTAVTQGALSSLSFGFFGFGSSSSFATVGSLTLSSSGSVTGGVEDFNNGGSPTTSEAISTSSFITVGTGTSPGTATLATSVGTFSFDVYAIDSTHLKFIETDGQFTISGDAFTPGTSLPTSGTLAFTMSGSDTSGFPLSVGGLMPLDANSNVIAGGVEDFNDDGVVGQDTSFAGSFSALTGGRSVLTLTGFVNGAANALPGAYTFAAYPFTSNGVNGVQLLEIDPTTSVVNGVSSGAAYVQTGTTLGAAQGYGMNLSAINLGNGSGAFEEDDIAEFTATSAAFNGIVDLNDQGTPSLGTTLNANYSVDGTGRGTATTSNLFNFNFYVVNSSTFLMLETDTTQIGTGIFELQNAAGSPGPQPGIAMHASGHARP